MVHPLNLDLNLGPVQLGSGLNHSSEPNIGITNILSPVVFEGGHSGSRMHQCKLKL